MLVFNKLLFFHTSVRHFERGWWSPRLDLVFMLSFPEVFVSSARASDRNQGAYTAVSTKVVPKKRRSVRDNADWYYG